VHESLRAGRQWSSHDRLSIARRRYGFMLSDQRAYSD